MYSDTELRNFISEAKKATYAGHGAEIKPSRLKSKDLPYEKGKFKYLDSYAGELHFIGEEVVWYNDEPVWGMNYYGTLLDKAPQEFGEFLRTALRLVTPNAPYRGPDYYRERELEFICSWQGELSFFTGQEEILISGKPIYKLVFHGGKLQNIKAGL
jgi:hypothetical protein